MGKPTTKIDRLIFLFIFALSFVFLFRYLSISNDEMPLMDFWVGFKGFADRVFANQIEVFDIFPIPHGMYWGALGSIEKIFMMKVFACNNMAYVYGGMLFCLASVALVLFYYFNRIAEGPTFRKLIFAIFCISPIINLNQWEVFDLYCSLSFMQRIFFYITVFLLVDNRLIVYEEEKSNWFSYIGIGIFGAVVIICASSVYYPGFVAAIITVSAVNIFIFRELKQKAIKLMTMNGIIFSGALFDLLTTAPGAISANATGSMITSKSPFVFRYLQGVIIMLGSSVVPQSKLTNGFTLYYMIGFALLLLAIVSVWLFFKEKLFQISWFPLECLIYAGASTVVITYGRINSFGLNTLTSSRYVVETTLGLLGIILIGMLVINKNLKDEEAAGLDCFSEPKKESLPIKAISSIMVLSVFFMICYSDFIEYKIGPYRKAYNQKMIHLALNIDRVADSELSVFQSAPGNVRSGIQAMKRYNLCLWNERSKYYQTTFETVKLLERKGIYDDGWIAPDAVYSVLTDHETMVRLEGYYPYFVNNWERIIILLNEQEVEDYLLESQSFTIDIPVETQSEYTLEIRSSFSHVTPPDTRELSFLLTDISLLENDTTETFQNAA